MRVASLYRYQLPMKTGVVLRHRPFTEREGLIVQLCEKGQTGWGEIAPLPFFSRETLAQAEYQTKLALQQWRAYRNDNLDHYAPSVAFGISCALAELDQQLDATSGEKTALLCDPNDKSIFEKLASLKGEKVAKMKIGFTFAEKEGELANDFLAQFPNLQLRFDANRLWTFEQAVQFAEKIVKKHRSRIQFIEEPCKTMALSRQFAEQCQINIAWDESLRENHFSFMPTPYLRAIVIKPTLTGSLQKCIQLIKRAHQQNLIAVISSSIESSLGLTQLARFAHQYTPNITAGLDTLPLMQTQLLRAWKSSPLPIADLQSQFIYSVPIEI